MELSVSWGHRVEAKSLPEGDTAGHEKGSESQDVTVHWKTTKVPLSQELKDEWELIR